MPNEKPIMKPCPFCGGRATIQQDTRYPRYGKKDTVKAYEPICTNPDCLIYEADNVYFTSESEAIAAWNTRADESASYQQVKKQLADEGFSDLATMISRYKQVMHDSNEADITKDEELADLRAQLAESEAQFKAAMDDMKRMNREEINAELSMCGYCKHGYGRKCDKCDYYSATNGFEWRGLTAQEHNHEE